MGDLMEFVIIGWKGLLLKYKNNYFIYILGLYWINVVLL